MAMVSSEHFRKERSTTRPCRAQCCRPPAEDEDTGIVYRVAPQIEVVLR